MPETKMNSYTAKIVNARLRLQNIEHDFHDFHVVKM